MILEDERRRRQSARKIAASSGSSGGTFTLTNVVLNSSRTPFLVSRNVLDSEGNSFTIFA